jgi:P22_AR N-terminal domain
MSQETSTILVPFHGDQITCVETPEGAFVAIKPICERLGIAFPPQWKKLKANPERWSVTLMVIPSARGGQETCCIPVSKVFGWLATITVSRVKPEVRDVLIAYQNEADEVLDRHFRLKDAEMERHLWHAHQQLRIDNPKWARVFTMMEIGESDYLIAQRCNWSMDRERSEVAAMRRCGMSATWRRDMATLAEQNLNLRWEMDRRERQEDLFGDAADV